MKTSFGITLTSTICFQRRECVSEWGKAMAVGASEVKTGWVLGLAGDICMEQCGWK